MSRIAHGTRPFTHEPRGHTWTPSSQHNTNIHPPVSTHAIAHLKSSFVSSNAPMPMSDCVCNSFSSALLSLSTGQPHRHRLPLLSLTSIRNVERSTLVCEPIAHPPTHPLGRCHTLTDFGFVKLLWGRRQVVDVFSVLVDALAQLLLATIHSGGVRAGLL